MSQIPRSLRDGVVQLNACLISANALLEWPKVADTQPLFDMGMDPDANHKILGPSNIRLPARLATTAPNVLDLESCGWH